MSQDQPPSRKDRKAQRDAERRKGGKKRKHEEVEQAEDAESRPNELQDDFIPLDSSVDGAKNRSKKSSSTSKKRKVEHGENLSADNAAQLAETTTPKPKKRKKSKKATTQNGEDAQAITTETSSGNHRFVCFIGNLPYDTTDASLQAHFKKLAPFTLRHRTDPATKKSKGFAFLEFENYDRMKTCLKLYHHSMFDPATAVNMDGNIEQEGEGGGEVSGKKGKGARRINVELTAGGGGKTAARKEKIKVKNARLDEQRQRRAEAERLEKAKAGQKKGASGKKGEVKAVKRVDKGSEQQDVTAGVHPSRLARIQT